MKNMEHLRCFWISLSLLVTIVNAVADGILPACQSTDFHFEYTECDSEGGRWRVAVPKPGVCVGGAPPPPQRGKGCAFTCDAGQYINIQADQECHSCPAGTYSLGGGVRFEDWDHLPSGFSIQTEDFADNTLNGRRMMGFNKDHAASNCSSGGWTTKGRYMSSMASECSTTLVYSANLVKAGYVKFVYQYTDNSFFQFQVQNDQCQSVGTKNAKWPKPTQDGEWGQVTVSLKSGLNLLHWKTIGMTFDSGTHYHSPVLIKMIEVSGVAYTSECTKCMNGTFSGEGASFCEECPENHYSHRGASTCIECDPDSSYSDPGAAFCLPKKPCTQDNYFEINTGCDANNQTQRQYSWISPKICSDIMPGAVQLPPPSEKEECPPCNPGMAYTNGACEFCPVNQYSSGSSSCTECSASTAPEYGLYLKWWKNIPTKANITTSCLSMNERGCTSRSGWITDNDYIYSGRGHADDSYLVLTLKIGGFRGRQQQINGKPVPVATITFYFELECTAECTFFFMQNTDSASTAIVNTWEGSQSKDIYTMDIYKTEPVEFNWAFQKRGWDEQSPSDLSQSYEYKNDIAKIYEITVTNTFDGGAYHCKNCPKGANMQGCIPCPAGQYISSNTSQCTACPHNSVVRTDDPWGVEACIPCGNGLIRSADKRSCMTDCKVRSPSGQVYDFTSLQGVQTTTGARLFTSSGTQYYHLFNFSLCANDQNPVAMCKDNISYGIGDQLFETTNHTDNSVHKEEVEEHVSSLICRSTLIPPASGDDDTMAAQPVSLGDILVNITSDPQDLYHIGIVDMLKQQGFSDDGSELDVHFLYMSGQPTSACHDGRTSVVTLRCDMSQKGAGIIDVPPRCPDGTCDGCNFHFLWRTEKACPLCKKQDYSVVPGVCKDGVQIIHYIPPKHCVLQSGNEAYTQNRTCTILPFWLQIGIGVIIGLGLLMLFLVIYCWKKNRKLEYKYSKLAVPNKDGELPPVDTCALDDDEDDEQFDSVQFSENKGRKFFNKIKNIAKKDDNPFETIALNDKNAMM